MKWYPFDKAKGSYQKRPPVKKYVLVMVDNNNDFVPNPVVLGYRKNAAGDKQCPYFVTLGINGKVLAWCDCLPEDIKYQLEYSGVK